MRIVFTNPVYLWFLLSIPFLIVTHLFTLRYMRGSALKFSNFEAIARVSGEYKLAKPYSGLVMNKNLFMLLLRVLTLLFVILSLSNMVLWYTGKSSEFDFVLAIDASSSMLATDLLPNRLEAAKNSANLFVDSVPGKVNVGVVSFAGVSFVEQRITENKNELKEKINKLATKSIGGTDLGGALVSSSNLLMTSDNPKVIILLTDGRSNVGLPTDNAISYLNENDIVVHTIGIGTEEGGSFSLEGLISTLDEKTLKKIAQETNGRYFKAKDEEELDKAYTEIANMRETQLPLNLSFPLIVAALLLLFLEWVLVNTKYRIIS